VGAEVSHPASDRNLFKRFADGTSQTGSASRLAVVATDTIQFRRGAGRMSLDFIRTRRHRGTPRAAEELSDPAALTAWVHQLGPCPPEPAGDRAGSHPSPPAAAARTPASPAQVAEARELREAIHELITAARGPGVTGCSAAARERINQAAAGPVPAPSLDGSGRLRWRAEDPVAATLALVARDALDLVGSGAAARVRGCANPDCGALFLDSSRPGTRRWCSMGTCGNQAKKETLRGRAGR
jgi:predicted RNA-binding Zn ribbon-like protein